MIHQRIRACIRVFLYVRYGSNKTVTQHKIPSSIFKAYDIRGIVGDTLNPELVYAIGRAFGSEALEQGEKHVYVGRDGRLSGPELLQALISGLCASGIDVINIGCVPTPVLYYAAYAHGSGTGIMLTGSHNPPDYNGMKMVIGEDTLAGERIQKLRQRVEQMDVLEGEGACTEQQLIDDYITRITDDIKLKRSLHVVVDCGNGAAGSVAPQLLKALGCKVTELYCEVDGNFPNHHPDPSQPENLQDLIQKVEELDADLGMAFDGDGDRLGVITREGEIIWPDRLMMLYARDILSRHPGAEIIYDIKCSSNLGQSIEQDGGKPLMWQTGHSLIKAKMKASGALLAGEMSGHIFFKERWYGFDDATYTASRLLELLAADPRHPSQVMGELPNAVNTPELHIDMKEGEHFQFMTRLIESAKFEGADITTIDGIRVDYDDGWGLVRASNTTPCLVLRFEGKDQETLERIQDKFRQAILKLDSSLSLPF